MTFLDYEKLAAQWVCAILHVDIYTETYGIGNPQLKLRNLVLRSGKTEIRVLEKLG